MQTAIQAKECPPQTRESAPSPSAQKPPPPFTSQKERTKSKLSMKLEESSLPLFQEAIDEEKLLVSGVAPLLPIAPLDEPPAFSPIAISGVELPSEVMELFEKSVNAMAHQMHSGVSETTFYLDSPRFNGAKVVITEFNTAPKVFNISLIGTPETAALFSLHAPDLITAFQKSPFLFTVHRLDSDIEVHAVDRKENVGEEKEDEGNER